MAALQFFDRELRLATAGLDPAQINAALAKYAKQALREAVAAGASPEYIRYVNGREGAVEESVKAPGPILYEFVNWPLIINAALAELDKRAPRKSGRYAASFVVMADQKVVSDYRGISPDAEVIIFNRQPYTRRIEAGANNSAGKRHFDLSELAINRRFSGVFTARTMFLTIASGLVSGVPYILKGQYARLRNARIANPAKFNRSFPKRKDSQPGQPLTYPAIVINAL